MNICTKTIWIAAYRVLENASVGVGDSISLKELMRHWTHTHLRQNDLAHALDTLVRAGQIRLEMDNEGPRVRLADASFIDNLPEQDLSREVETLEQLAWIRRQQSDKAQAARGRRFSDSDLQRYWKRIVNG